MQRGHVVFLIAMLFYFSFASATDRISGASGNWTTAGTWSPAGTPAAGDNITIAAGHTIIMNGSAGNCLSLTVNGFADWTNNRITNVGAGGLILNGTGQLNNSTSTGTLNVAGNFTVSAGATASINSLTVSVTGSTSILGTLTFGHTSGTKTFTGDITINNGGTWNSTVAESFTFNGSLINNGTFTASTGTYTLGGSAQTLSGTNSIIFVNTAINGSYTNNGAVQINTNMSGSGTLTQGANSTLIIGDTTPANILTASATGNTVRYLVSASMSTLDITYYNLIIEELGGTVNGSGTYTVNGDYTLVSGTASLTSVTVSGNVTVNSGTTLNIGAGPFSVSGTTAITGTVTVTSTTSTKTFQGVVFNSGGVWNNTAAETFAINGNVTMSGGTLAGTATTATGIYNIAGALNITSGTTNSIGRSTLNVTGATTVDGTLQITSATGTKTFNDLTVSSTGTWNSIVSSGFTINGNLSNSGTFTANNGTYRLAGSGKIISGTLSVPTFTVTGSYTNNGTVTSTTALRGAGIFSQGTTGTLNVSTTSANFSVTTFNASASGNTVDYYSTIAQNVRIPSDGSYHHLAISGSGTKTLLGATDINGNLTINISSALAANNFNITLGGNWSSTGSAFVPGTNTVTLDGAAQSIGRTGGETFNHLTVSGTGIKTLTSDIITNGNLSINSTLDISASNFAIDVNGNWTNNGTFTQGIGTVTFSGSAAQSIGGTATTNFNNIIQNNAAGVSLSQHQNLIDSLLISSGTFTVPGINNFTLKSTSSGTARIAEIPSGANFAGNIVMERFAPASSPTMDNWRLLCSAVSGATIADWADDFATSGFTGSTDPSNLFVSIYSYDETQPGNLDTFGYVPAANVSDIILNGTGYYVYLDPTPVTFEVTGPPNTFSQSLPVTYTNSGDIFNDGWNLVANPYPSAIDWDDASWTQLNINPIIYIWNSSTDTYAYHSIGNQTCCNGGSRYVASQQAFWVQANGSGTPTLTATETVKASDNSIYLKTASTPNTSHYPMAFQDFPIPFNTNNIANNIKFTASGGGYPDDEMLIRFMQGATNNFDSQYDAWKLPGSYINLSSVITGNLDLAINSYPELDSNFVIPIRITVPITGTYSIRRDSILMLPSSSCVYLEDLLNGNMTDLRTNISYSFTIADTTAAPRFLLHVYAPVSKHAVDAQCAGDSSGMAVATGTGTGPWNYVWTNSNGDTLQITSNSTSPDSLFNLPAGVYTVEVSGSVCGTVTDTIVINSTAIAVTVNYADVSCYGLSDGTAAVAAAGGSGSYTYLWNPSVAATATATGLSAGTYSVTVTDAGGCSQTQTFSISQPAQIISGFTSSTDTVDISFNNSASFTNTSSGATGYYWYFGDSSAIDTAQNPVHYYSYSGTYTAMLIAFNGSCSDTSFKIIEVINSLNIGIAQTTASSAYVNVLYENGEVFMEFNLPEKHDVSISIYNTLGERIVSQLERNILKGRVKLRVENLASGVYVSAVEMKPIGNSHSGLNDLAIAKKIIIFGK